MRRQKEQLPLTPPTVDHAHARELAKISEILDANSELAKLIEQDLLRGVKNPHLGCAGMSGDQVLRVLVLKQMNTFSYEDLEFHLKDSATYRTFCRIGLMDSAPGRSTIAENVKKLRWRTLEKVSQIVVDYAKQKGVETGEKVRVDSTTVESHIHRPTDSGLLYDGVRVLARLLARVKKVSGYSGWQDHTRRAKRRMIGIHRTRKEGVRLKAYRDLLKVVRKTLRYARAGLESLGKKRGRATRLRRKLVEMIELVERVRQQTEQRVLRGEKVETAQRIVSIFEPHADVLVKDHKDTYYGHKVSLTGGASGMLLDCVIEDGNPNDATRTVPMIKRQKKLYGRAPKQAALDGTYASRPNLKDIKKLGVEEVCFSAPRGMSAEEMAGSRSVYRRLRDFRAGIEGIISFVKRCFGMKRCTWRGEPSFRSYVWSSVLSANLLILARHLL
jgi:transposase, IS5 family